VPSRLSLICHPFHNGLKGVDMGAGPLRLLADPDLVPGIEAQGWVVDTVAVEPPDERDPEIVRVAEANRRLAESVRAATAGGAFPLVLAGNCNSCLGTVAGLDPRAAPLGVVWFDAHADFDTPDRSLGFFDGMGLAILTGNGWELLRGTIDGFAPVEERSVVLAGVRDLEEHQRRPLESSALRVVPGRQAGGPPYETAVEGLAELVSRAYLHVDLDVLDPSEGRANRFAAEGGLSLGELDAAVGLAFDRLEIAAAAITAYDPSLDADGRMARAASRVLGTVARRAFAQRGRETG
jgi:arginase